MGYVTEYKCVENKSQGRGPWREARGLSSSNMGRRAYADARLAARAVKVVHACGGLPLPRSSDAFGRIAEGVSFRCALSPANQSLKCPAACTEGNAPEAIEPIDMGSMRSGGSAGRQGLPLKALQSACITSRNSDVHFSTVLVHPTCNSTVYDKEAGLTTNRVARTESRPGP